VSNLPSAMSMLAPSSRARSAWSSRNAPRQNSLDDAVLNRMLGATVRGARGSRVAPMTRGTRYGWVRPFTLTVIVPGARDVLEQARAYRFAIPLTTAYADRVTRLWVKACALSWPWRRLEDRKSSVMQDHAVGPLSHLRRGGHTPGR
jgi:hypothetical protein